MTPPPSPDMAAEPGSEETLFAAALQRETPAQRAAYLDEACAGNPALRARVEGLLQASGEAQTFLERPVGVAQPSPSVAATVKVEFADLAPLTEGPGTRIGRYKLLQQIGEGGCGTVFMAEQEEPVRRRVALKVIKLGMDTKSVVARFEAERQALALMDHPNIAKVLDAGATDSGRPFFVMELVRGIPITRYCDQNKLDTKQRLDLFIRVCHAIQHAHQKGIIHRDIKPSNILVTLHDGVPVPKVIDFGIAKATEGRLTDRTLFTAFEQFIGTPAYMSPEQAEMSGLDMDTRSDIYALGVLLYELLTGRTPFDAKELAQAGLDEMRRRIREVEPPRPSTRLSTLQGDALTAAATAHGTNAPKLLSLIRGDLDWIVMKCLEKDRTRRYETANGLAADLKRHLNHEPVVARPPSTAYRMQKAWRRNKLAFTAATAVAVALVCGILISAWQAVRATRAEREQTHLRTVAETARAGEAAQRQQAEAAQANETRLRKLAELEAYAADMKAAQAALQQNNRGQAVDLLNHHRPRPGEDDLRGIEWRYLWRLARGDDSYVWQHPSMVVGARFSPDGRLVVTTCYDGFLRVWDVASRKLLTQIDRGVRDDNYIGSFRFSPDGRTLASAHQDGFIVLDTSSWRVIRRLPDPAGTPGSQSGSDALAYSSDGRLLATRSSGRIRIWDLADERSFLLGGAPWGRSLAFTPDNRTLILGGAVGRFQLWDVASQAEIPLQQAEWPPDAYSFQLIVPVDEGRIQAGRHPLERGSRTSRICPGADRMEQSVASFSGRHVGLFARRKDLGHWLV